MRSGAPRAIDEIDSVRHNTLHDKYDTQHQQQHASCGSRGPRGVCSIYHISKPHHAGCAAIAPCLVFFRDDWLA